MPKKLYFRYGAVSSAKTLELLRVAYNYEQQGKKVVCIKPKIDTRFGIDKIQTRIGLSRTADIISDKDTDIYKEIKKIVNNKDYRVDCILVDEVNFMSSKEIMELRSVVTDLNIPVICYGLKTDYLGNLFEGSYTLLACADSIEEIKITCNYCNSKATMNLKIENGKAVRKGDTKPDLGCEEKYLPVCYKHFINVE